MSTRDSGASYIWLFGIIGLLVVVVVAIVISSSSPIESGRWQVVRIQGSDQRTSQSWLEFYANGSFVGRDPCANRLEGHYTSRNDVVSLRVTQSTLIGCDASGTFEVALNQAVRVIRGKGILKFLNAENREVLALTR